jgi:hypothetical protein
VRVGREHWSAESAQGEIPAGTVVRVVGRSGLKLMVVADPTQIGGDPMTPSLPRSDGPDQGGVR